MAAATIHNDLEPKKTKYVTVAIFSICHEGMGPDAMILVFLMLSFKSAFSLSSFTLIKTLFSSFHFLAIRVVSSAYLRLLIFFQAVLIPASDSSSPAFPKMYSAYRAFPVVQGWRICLQCRRCRTRGFDPWVGKMLWRRKWQPNPVFLPGKFQGQKSLAGHSPWGCKELYVN